MIAPSGPRLRACQTMQINPDIFKAYDIRGLYPSEIDEATVRQIGRGFVSYLKATRIGVSRDMRVSSPALAAAFIEGAREQGAIGHRLRHAAHRRALLRGRQRRPARAAPRSRRRTIPKQYNGIKMVRSEALPLSGDAGIGDIRDMIANDRLPPPAAHAREPDEPRRPARIRRQGDVVHRSVDHQAVQRGPRRRQRHGRTRGAAALRPAAVPHDARCASRSTARFPTTRPTR